jgi:hypothetical protein
MFWWPTIPLKIRSLGVFGSDAFNDIIAGGDETTKTLWIVIGSGNDSGNGAIGTSTGVYVSVDGETAIGLTADGTLDPVYGEEITCVFMGSISMGKNNAWKGKIVEVN